MAASGQAEAHIVVDDDDAESNDADSTLGEETSSTASLTSSIRRYRLENGRTYHSYKEGSYLYPNDEFENERMDLMHHLWVLTFDGALGFAPPNEKGASPARVLDIGTGTGIWAIDFADEHPGSHVIGTDLSPIQPNYIAPNVEFQVDDVELEWTFTKPFDYIHCRVMNSSIRAWPELLKQCYDHLVPGGWIEIHELCPPTCDDGTMGPDTAQYQAWTVIREVAAKLGQPFVELRDFKGLLEDAGFDGVVEKHFVWPSSPWPRDPKLKQLAIWNVVNTRDGVEGFLLAACTRSLGWSKERVYELAERVKTELKSRAIHAYNPIVALYAQKPESGGK